MLSKRMMMAGGAGDSTFLGDLVAAGIGGSNLELCLDMGALGTYSGSGQDINDLTANGVNFYRGADNTATTDDPTFNGTAGDLSSSEYFSFDGGDYFTKSSANNTFLNTLHQNNAKWAWAGWIYFPASIGTTHVFSTVNNPSGREGVFVGTNSASKSTVEAANASASSFSKVADAANVKALAWNFMATAIDEAGGAVSYFYLGNATFGNGYDQAGASDQWDAAFSSPGTANGSILQLGTRRDTTGLFPSGTRLGMVAMWNGGTLPTKAQFDTFYASSKTRWGL